MEAGGRDAFSERPVFTDQVEDLYSGTKERSAWLLNVGSERFHEGRGAGKSTTPGGREKHAYFLEMRLEPAFKGTGRLRQDL